MFSNGGIAGQDDAVRLQPQVPGGAQTPASAKVAAR